MTASRRASRDTAAGRAYLDLQARAKADGQPTEALRRWLRRRGCSPAQLLKLAAQLPRAESSLRRSLQILL